MLTLALQGPGSTQPKGTVRKRVVEIVCDLPMPTVRIYGFLPKDTIRRVVRSHKNEIRWCYEKAMGSQGPFQTRLHLYFVIDVAGQMVVSNAIAWPSVPGLEQCVSKAIVSWVFPKMDTPRVTEVHYPVVLSPKIQGRERYVMAAVQDDDLCAIGLER